MQEQPAGPEAQAAAPQAAFPGNSGTNGANRLPSPGVLGFMAEHFMKSVPDHMKEQELMTLQETNPQLARAIQQRIKVIENAKKAVTALPEQKPPRNPEKAGI